MPLVANGYQGQDCSLHEDQKSGAARFLNGITGNDAVFADVKGLLPKTARGLRCATPCESFHALVA